ncbi:ABC transporter permease [Limnochorda pilosa]|uniref:Peptide ABC transporter permease n=1 Tax=Limnochorda pilosa TaxID=1555112 RepID=A0A0K2SKE6_LIMPI|nr:ABC transporter permease [Limnochorda pilosa]BAS27570.1 peptide ABC transporter permease [Limnochorda pilosa]
MGASDAAAGPVVSVRRLTARLRFRRRPLLWIGAGVVVFFLLVSLLAPWLAPYHPTEYRGGGRLQPPSAEHWLGTDQLGRDVLSRLIYGGRIPLEVSVVSAAFALAVGTFLGWISGFVGRYPDRLLSLAMDSIYSFPSLVLAIIIAAMLGPGLPNMILAVSVVYVPTYFRVARAQVLQIKEREHVEAARAIGASSAAVLFRHVAPNTLNAVLAITSFNVADAILTAAGLSFLGLGIAPPTPDWGWDLQSGRAFLPSGIWWPVTFPGLLVVLLALGFGMLGEGISDWLNPRR